MFTELQKSLPVTTTKGDGWAIAVIDYSQDHNLIWVVVLNKNGEVWCIPNYEIRVERNYSLGRNF